MKRLLVSTIIIALMVLPILAPISALATASTNTGQAELIVGSTKAYIHEAFKDNDNWVSGVYVADPVAAEALQGFKAAREALAEKLGIELRRPSTDAYRALILVDKETGLQAIPRVKENVQAVLGIFPTFQYYIVSAWVTSSQLEALAKTPGVVAVLPDVRLDSIIIKETEYLKKQLELLEGKPKYTPAPEAVPSSGYGLPAHYTVNITRAINVWDEYNITGQYTTIAIIDTGVDYASPGLGLEAIARDENGIPLILDDNYGIVLTPVQAEWVNNTTIYVNITKLYVYWADYPAVVKIDVGYAYGPCSYLEYSLPENWTVPSYLYGKPVRFGLADRVISTPVGYVFFTVPVIFADSNGDGYYDLLLLDMSTAWYYFRQTLACLEDYGFYIPPGPTAPDFNFTDETPVYYGNEIAALDLDADGYYDFSVGTLAGYAYDAYGIILLAMSGYLDSLMEGLSPWQGYIIMLTDNELWHGDYIGYVWPGIDYWTGRYVTLEYDFHSHGTFCAATAAGRPHPAYVGYGSDGFSDIIGQAPSAKIAAANALTAGDVATAIYFFSGFDLATPYGDKYWVPTPFQATNPWIAFSGGTWIWTYTGNHQVDITSNSYGISGWAIWGWASGMDPESMLFDYTSAVSGTAHFVAAGNGGPGWGTVTTPGSSALAITVGATTEFTYRPFYGYLPGGNSEIITWSDRGPNELGLAKPDVVAIGSFAWASGRPWDALAWGAFTGVMAYDLFGGTSQATPMAAGVAALIVSAYKEATGNRMPAYLLKTILMNSARDIGYNAFSQGAGFVDALAGVEKVLNNGFKVYSMNLKDYYVRSLAGDTASINYADRFDLNWYEPKIVVMGQERRAAKATLTIEGSGTYTLTAVQLQERSNTPLCRVIDRIMEGYVRCYGTIMRVDLGRAPQNGFVFMATLKTEPLLSHDLVEITLSVPFQYFQPGGRSGTPGDTAFTYAGPELWYWIDLNGDNEIQLGETARIMYDLRGANAWHIQVAKLADQIREIENLIYKLYGVDVTNCPCTKKLVLVFRIWGNTYAERPTYTVPVYARVHFYDFVKWRDVRVPSTVTVSGSKTIEFTIRLPRKAGIQEGYILVTKSGTGETALVPVTAVAYKYMRATSPLRLYPFYERSFYRNMFLGGAFDYYWRYESGDWRVFTVYVADPSIKAIVVELRWPGRGDYASNLDVHVYGPWTYYFVDVYGSSGSPYPATPVTVHGLQLGAELSLGQRYFWDEPQPGYSKIVVPVSQPGLYRIVVRNIHFNGARDLEPFYLTVYPVRVYGYTTTVGQGSERTLIMRIYARAGLPGANITIGDEAIYEDRNGNYYYCTNKTMMGLGMDIVYMRVRTTKFSTIMYLKLKVSANETTPEGTYLVPLLLTSDVAVTSAGALLSGGSPYVYFWYNVVPIYVKIVVR